MHCYGHALSLSVCDAIKMIPPLRSTMDTVQVISKLLQCPKRSHLFKHLQEEISPDTACATCPFCLHCVTPAILTPNRCEMPRCHGCACDLLMCVRDLCTQATKSSGNVTSVYKTVRCVKLTFR